MAGDTQEMIVAGRGIGVDIGSHSVKVAVVRRQLGGLVLDRVVERPIAREGPGRPPAEAISAAIASAMEEVTVGRAVVVVGVPTQLTTVRNLDVPFRDERRIRRILKGEVEPHLPFAAEDIVVDYSLTGVEREAPAGEEGGSAPTNVLITAVQKNVVGDVLGLLRFGEAVKGAEGIDPEVTEVEFMGAFSAARTLAPETTSGSELVIDVGAVKTSVIFARGGRPLAVRSINVGGDALTQAVAQATGTSFAQAEEQMQSHSLPTDPEARQEPAAQALTDALGGLRRGLDQTLRFFASQVGEVNYDRVVLVGGSAALDGLAQWLAAGLSKDVAVLDSLGPVKSATDETIPVARCATAIGLALRGVGESVSRHNFRREELAYPNPLKRLVKYLAPAVGLIVGLVVVAIAGYFISYESTLSEARQYTQMKDRELQTIPGTVGRYDTLAAARKTVDERAAELDSLLRQNPQSVLDVLYELSGVCYDGKLPDEDATIPENKQEAIKEFIKRSSPWLIQITSFQVERGRVEIEGTAANYVAVSQLKQKLTASGLFADVDVGPSAARKGRVTLKIRFYLQERKQIR